MKHAHAAAFALALSAAAAAHAQYDTSAVTNLCQNALVGQQIGSPIRGFELLLLKDGRPFYHRAFGTGTIDRPTNADSSSKTVSAAVIMAMVDATANSPVPFTLDTRVSTILPGFTGTKSNINIRQCFAHTAGFGFSTAISNPAITLQQAAADIADDTLAYLPGTTFSYGGTSMHVAGAALEAYAATGWNTLFQQRVAVPLGMSTTVYQLTSPTNPRIGGGCETTAREFGSLMEMIRRGGLHRRPDGTDLRVLSAASAQAIITRQTTPGMPIASSPLPGSSDYGVGVWLWTRNPTSGNLERALAAGARGFSAYIDLDDGITGVISTESTFASNVTPWLALVADAAQAAVRTTPCTPDVASPGLAIGGDGELTADDTIVFVNWFISRDPRADIAGPGQSTLSDRELTADDIIVFISRFARGC